MASLTLILAFLAGRALQDLTLAEKSSQDRMAPNRQLFVVSRPTGEA
jgi:hypothetical protein